MKRYVIKRLLYFIPVVLSVITLSFLLIQLAPGDPAALMAGEGATPEYIENVRKEFGLDKPLHEQFIIYISHLLRGDWGFSLTYNRPVLNVIVERVPQTILLVGTGLTLAIALGMYLGIVSAKNPYSIKDNLITLFSLLFYSLPVFWLAQLLILFFGVYLRVFPAGGMYSIGAMHNAISYLLDILWHLILPASALAAVFLAIYSRLTRAGLMEVMGMNFILAARAKGVPERDILYRHALRNALLPVVTMAGIQFGLMISGVVLTETVFAWPGVGRLLTEAVFYRDYPLIMGVFIFVSISVVVANIVTDIIYALIDPRITYG